MHKSLEQQMKTEFLPKNEEEMDVYFGTFFQLMRQSLGAGGSELGLGMTLFSLAVSIQATSIIEIGRFKGFSTLCLASALRFLDIGWQEPQQHKQRPDMDYNLFEKPRSRRVYSVDPFPTEEATQLIEKAGLSQYIEYLDVSSTAVQFTGKADLIFIDGDHTYKGCKQDVVNYIPSKLRDGGYFILHDFFGWYDAQNQNNSPVKRVIEDLISEGNYQHILIDTGYPSFVVFRKPDLSIGM
ncbi:class I SAM-dependent methyltransferase [bacterium]|nr:class I SAM-dependent methyltransferase [bacterium]